MTLTKISKLKPLSKTFITRTIIPDIDNFLGIRMTEKQVRDLLDEPYLECAQLKLELQCYPNFLDTANREDFGDILCQKYMGRDWPASGETTGGRKKDRDFFKQWFIRFGDKLEKVGYKLEKEDGVWTVVPD